MDIFKKYYKKRSVFHCPECKYIWQLSPWQWFWTLTHNDITRHRYVKCPRCGARHWLQAKKVE